MQFTEIFVSTVNTENFIQKIMIFLTFLLQTEIVDTC